MTRVINKLLMKVAGMPRSSSLSNGPRAWLFSVILAGLASLAFCIVAPARAQVPGWSSEVQTHLDRCVAYYKRGDLRQAIAELREAQHIAPRDARISFMLGNALYRSGDLPGA